VDTLQDPGWRNILQSQFDKDYFKEIIKFLDKEQSNGKEIFPPANEVFNAFNYTPWDQVKVVILGKDPYFNKGQAHGICFSVKKGVKVPPSLKNMYTELERSIEGFKAPVDHGHLENWARRGVLMLNATMTVQKGKANSHKDCGWLKFTDYVLEALSKEKEGLIFLLWGGFAQKKGSIIDSKRHHVLTAVHPSPLAGKAFQGCDHFAETNKILEKDGKDPIDWSLD